MDSYIERIGWGLGALWMGMSMMIELFIATVAKAC